MENFKTIYNETKIYKANNSWNYYFENVSEYTLEETQMHKVITVSMRIFSLFQI